MRLVRCAETTGLERGDAIQSKVTQVADNAHLAHVVIE